MDILPDLPPPISMEPKRETSGNPSAVPEHVIQQVLISTDIVAVVSAHVSLMRDGPFFRGPCPFHDDQRKSLTVHPVRRLYHCWGCGAGGNVIHFTMRKMGLGFEEAVQKLAEAIKD
jgi:DNA primase